MKWDVGVKDGFKMEAGLHQGSTVSPFLFVMVMDRLTDVVRQESLWTMMFADDIVMEQVEEILERWRYVLERRVMKGSCRETLNTSL